MSVYDFNVKNMDGEIVDLGQYRGRVLLIVNTASK
jgi:glutathione peroxidase